MKKLHPVVMLLLTFAISFYSYSQQVSISEAMVSFKTYPYSDPDPVAKITHFYPYYRFDGFTNTPVEQEWKIVTLENPYIKVLVAPEMGGKVLGAIDKASGEEFIYFNKVVKFRDIAMRGAWTSGGIEFNFGSIGHAPTTASPVNYLLRNNPDGSVSCIVGAPDITSRTEWRVEIRLQPDKSYFETRAIWYNPSDLNTSLYNWSTASLDVSDDLEYYFPGDTEIGHVGETGSWPVNNNGVDVSKYPNNNFGGPKSYHVLGEYADYFLCYFRDKKFGLGHWAPYDEKPGKKIWMWALSREGEIWKDLLTDPGNKQYTEIQTGFLFNQASPNSTLTPYKHQFFYAGSEHKFTELWFPVKDIGGMVKANRFGSLNVEQKNGKLTLGFCANQEVKEKITILSDGKILVSKDVDLQPTEAFVDSFDIADENLEVRIGDLMSYSTSERKERLSEKPRQLSPEYDWNKPDALFISGVEKERQRDYAGAAEIYSRVLEENPFYADALVKMGGLRLRAMNDEEAEKYLMKALSVDTYHPEANYLLGLIYQRQQKFFKALEAYSVAARSVAFKTLAYTKIAGIYFLQKEFDSCLRYADQALDYDRNNINALMIEALAYEHLGKAQKRESALDAILALDPLNTFARFEKQDDFATVLNYEMPQQICLEQAIVYHALGCDDKAVKILQAVEPGPIGNYWLAFLTNDNTYLDKALSGSPYLVYPSRNETYEVLKGAEEKVPSWKTKYYLALLTWSKGNKEDAGQYLKACNSEPDFDGFYLTRYHFMSGDEAYDGEADLRKALTLNDQNWRNYLELSNYFHGKQQFEEALSWAEKGAALFPNNYVLAYQKAKELLLNEQYSSAFDLLGKTTILPNEGARAGRLIWRQSALMTAVQNLKSGKSSKAFKQIQMAREWPESLGVGKPYETDERIEDALESLYWTKKGDTKKANELKNRVIDYSKSKNKYSVSSLLAALFMKQAGNVDEARSLLQEWKSAQANNPVAAWAYEMLFGSETKAAALQSQIKATSGGSLLTSDVGLVLAVFNAINE
ncbi:DUF5107 domain-containing protein [Maribellus sp. YY47]|uniref:DUF5107 domain-containing protein n=1 Tax=Maribellus sp. YY47 TaxID=2929486 RepID=UPI0020011EB9|nr:DUF5107 domain-containing protein [Maribellus sp. YY47]MCK3685607.1 DUF5107 domain-containing protein [Maribellus sp. YY47]